MLLASFGKNSNHLLVVNDSFWMLLSLFHLLSRFPKRLRSVIRVLIFKIEEKCSKIYVGCVILNLSNI